MARELSAQGLQDGSVLLIESPKHVCAVGVWEALAKSPGNGEFSLPGDRKLVAEVLKYMLVRKLDRFLDCGDLHNYRFFLNQQYMRYKNLEIIPIEGLLPTNLQEEGEEGDGNNEILRRFFYHNGFWTVHDRDKAGWSPLCYAVMKGDARVVEALLQKQANPNDCICKSKDGFALSKGSSVHSICAYFGSHETMRLLLQSRADPNKRDRVLGMMPLFFTSINDDVEGARILIDAKTDLTIKALGTTALRHACNSGATKVVKELLAASDAPPCQHLLHTALMFGGGAPDFVSTLVEASCEINQQFYPAEAAHRLIYLVGSAKHRLQGPSIFSTACYHHRGATPLMLSIISGYFAAAHILLQRGARVDLRNERNYTAFDFAVQKHAPEHLLTKLWRCGSGEYASKASTAWWCAHAIEPLGDVHTDDTDSDEADEDPMVSVQF